MPNKGTTAYNFSDDRIDAIRLIVNEFTGKTLY